MGPSVFIIAEAGSNWRMGSPERDLSMALTLIDMAADAGADAIKFQLFHPETIYVKNAGKIPFLSHQPEEEVQKMFEDLALPKDLISKLADRCKEKNIEFLCSVFSVEDFHAVDPFVSKHKLASYEINHIRLIEKMAHSGKPLLMSTGAADEADIDWAVECFFENGGKELILLQCTAKYPAEENTLNLNVIPRLRKKYRVNVGLSDHSRDPIYAPVAAVALGAMYLEKHFTLHNALPGPDHPFAVTPQELKEMVKAVRKTEKMLGSSLKIVQENEKPLRHFARRGVQAVKEIEKGDIFKEGKNIQILRPGSQKIGVHPKFLKEIEGRSAKRKISLGEGIQKGDWE